MKIEEKMEALNEYCKDLRIAAIRSYKHNSWAMCSYCTISKPNLPKIEARSFSDLINKAYDLYLKEDIKF